MILPGDDPAFNVDNFSDVASSIRFFASYA